MLISAPKARVNAYYYDKKIMQYVATSIATDEEKHEIEDCNARRESVRIREQKELMEAKKNLRELRKELGEEEFDQLMKKALGD